MSGAAIILAGGKSTRLGRDKASEVLLGHSLLQHAVDAFAGLVEEYVVVKALGQQLPDLTCAGSLTVIEDLYPETGPLGGIYTGLSASRAPYGVVVACDMPLLQPALLRELLRLAPEHEAVVPLNGLPEPLCAAYSKGCLQAVRRRLEAGAHKVTGFFDDVDVLYLGADVWRRFDLAGLSFNNLNCEEDLRRVEALLADSKGS